MPQATQDLRDEWHEGGDAAAIGYLEGEGFTLNRDWTWQPPAGKPVLDKKAYRAIDYLIQEWDFGGLAFEPGLPADCLADGQNAEE